MPLPLLSAPLAFLAKPLIKWGIIAAVIIGLGLAVVWFKHEAKVARESQAVAERQAAISAADAERWQAASDLRDQAITQLKAAYQIQTDLVKAGRAKEQALSAALTDTARRNVTLQTENAQLERDLDAEAAAMPGDVREIGPIVARRAKELFK